MDSTNHTLTSQIASSIFTSDKRITPIGFNSFDQNPNIGFNLADVKGSSNNTASFNAVSIISEKPLISVDAVTMPDPQATINPKLNTSTLAESHNIIGADAVIMAETLHKNIDESIKYIVGLICEINCKLEIAKKEIAEKDTTIQELQKALETSESKVIKKDHTILELMDERTSCVLEYQDIVTEISSLMDKYLTLLNRRSYPQQMSKNDY